MLSLNATSDEKVQPSLAGPILTLEGEALFVHCKF
jgi:hypothetical protein